MSDTEHPRPPRADLSADLVDGGHAPPAQQSMLLGGELEDPLSQHIFHWLNATARAAKGLRVYAANNEQLKRYIDDAYGMMEAIFREVPELTLSVREDRLLYGKDPVHVNPDRAEGMPFTFYRNAFRRITFVQGMTREELVALLSAIITDYSGFDFAGEDLVTALWRLQLPHLRYLTIDALSIDPKSATNRTERDEIERVQADIEGIVAQIYKTNAGAEDIVAGVSITKDDLEALKTIREESQEDLDLLDHATARAIADVPEEAIDAIQLALIGDTRDALSRRLMDVLVLVLFKEQSAAESAGTIELIQQLYDVLLVGQRYQDAIELIARLKRHTEETGNLKEIHIIRHLLRLFSTESRVVPVLNAFNDDYKQKSVHVLVDFLRALGPSIVPLLLGALDYLSSPAHRRLICDLVLEHGVPDRALLTEKMTGAKWFVVRDLLSIATRLPPEQLSPLIALALRHEHPKVREYAVGLLRGYNRGVADRLVAERLLDDDLEVRLAAIRTAAARRSPDAKPAIETVLGSEDLSDREPRELRLLMAAYASLAGPEAIPALERILVPGGFFSRSKAIEAQVAAAFALASIGTPAAMQAIHKGMRTLNTRVRDACKKALAREGDKNATADLITPPSITGGTPLPPAIVPAAEAPKSSPANPLNTPILGTELPPLDGLLEAKTAPGFPALKKPEVPGGEVTPAANRSAKSLGIAENAPEFFPEEIEETALAKKPAPVNVSYRTGPALGRVHVPHPVREEMPARIPVLRAEEPISLEADALAPAGDEEEDRVVTPVEPVAAVEPRLAIPDVKTEPGAPPPAKRITKPIVTAVPERMPVFERMPVLERPDQRTGPERISADEKVKPPLPGLIDDLTLDSPAPAPAPVPARPRRMIAEDDDE